MSYGIKLNKIVIYLPNKYMLDIYENKIMLANISDHLHIGKGKINLKSKVSFKEQYNSGLNSVYIAMLTK